MANKNVYEQSDWSKVNLLIFTKHGELDFID